MAEFTTKCPHCNIELVADEDWIGMELECPSCKQTLTVAKEVPKIFNLSIPQIKPITPTANANDENAETSFTFVCPECGTQVELPIILKGEKYECKACCEESIAEPATEKKCPHCGQMIKFHATICKFCKKNVDVSANASINLQPISPLGNQPLNLQPIQNNATPLMSSSMNQNTSDPGSWRITRQEIADIEKFYRFYWIGFLVGLVPLFGIGGAIVGMVFWFILLYRYWKLVPASEAETTPGKAVGFMFIPLFNLYWGFVSIWGLSKHFNRLAPEKNVGTFGLIIAISTVCCAIPLVNFAAIIVGIVSYIIWAYRMKVIAVSSIPVTD